MKHRKIDNVMTQEVIRVGSGAPFKEVAARLAEHGISGLPVVDADERVIGVISETDLMTRQPALAARGAGRRLRVPLLRRSARKAAAKARARTAEQLMSAPAVTIGAQQGIVEAARLMDKHGVGRLPVVDAEGRLEGIVTRRDLLVVFLRTDQEIRHEVVDEVLVRMLSLAPNAVEVTVNGSVVTLRGELERRSDVPIAVRLAEQVDGVIAVVDQLTYRLDDTRQRPTEPGVHGIGEEWLHRG